MEKIINPKFHLVFTVLVIFLFCSLTACQLSIAGGLSNISSAVNKIHGNSYARKTSPKQKYIPEISKEYIIDANNLWAGDSSKRELIKSTDGGKNWQLLSNGVYKKLNYIFDDPFDIFFVNKSHGWITTSEETWETKDGGDTWNIIFDKEIEDLVFHGPQKGWMSLGNQNELKNYRTGDGGQSWQPCRKNRKKIRLTGGGFFVSPLIGWSFSTTHPAAENGAYQTSGIAKTVDGGCRWREIWKAPDNFEDRVNELFFIDQSAGWFSTFAYNKLYQTTDGGKSWQKLPIPDEEGEMQTFCFKNKRQGWIVFAGHREDSIFYKTSDGGKSWSRGEGKDFFKSFSGEISSPRISQAMREAIINEKKSIR